MSCSVLSGTLHSLAFSFIGIVLLQNKTLSLNPAKKAVSILRRPFGSETDLSVGSQPVPVETVRVHETNDVSTELEAPATQAVTDTQDEVLCWCFLLNNVRTYVQWNSLMLLLHSHLFVFFTY